jgi:hypothetical protein
VELLKLIQAYFGGIGRIGKERNDCCDFSVSSLNLNKYYVLPTYSIISMSNKVFEICMKNLRAKARMCYVALETVQHRRCYSTKVPARPQARAGGFQKSNNDMHRSAAKYKNIDIEKLKILKENTQKSGIYMFT